MEFWKRQHHDYIVLYTDCAIILIKLLFQESINIMYFTWKVVLV